MLDPITLPFDALLHNRYRVLGCIGGGGFSQVFEVEDLQTVKPLSQSQDELPVDLLSAELRNAPTIQPTDQPVLKVVKLLNLSAFRHPQSQQKAIALFRREAQFLSQFRHPGVPRVEPDSYFVWYLDPQTPLHGLAMEKIAGLNLQTWLRQNQPLTQAQATAWLRQLVEILIPLHRQQFFHRDIKPSNIMLRPDGQLVLIDFGAVREITTSYLTQRELEETGTAIVSAGYTPPEQLEGRSVPQSDFFALGRTFVYLLTGSEILELPRHPQTGQLDWRPRAPQISGDLTDLIDILMAPTPEQRPQTGEAILHRLNRIERRSIWQRLPVRLATKQGWLRLGTTAVAGLPLLLGLWLARSGLSIALNEQGIKAHNAENLTMAQGYYRLALLFNAQNAEANFNLGDLHESQNQLQQAKSAYYTTLALEPSLWKADNNLARLEILDQRYDLALPLLKRALKNLDTESDAIDRATVLKNLGWAELGLKQYAEAEQRLAESLRLNPDQAAAHCLMVPVLRAQAKPADILTHYSRCTQPADPTGPDQQILFDLARFSLPTKVQP